MSRCNWFWEYVDQLDVDAPPENISWKQWVITVIINFMGRVYVILDSMLDHPKVDILNKKIDDDFQDMTRQQLCNHIESRFELEHDSFWNLQSTQKIRLGCQLARNFRKEGSL